MTSPLTPGFSQQPPLPPPLPPASINFGWIGESWRIFGKAWKPWLALMALPVAVSVASILYSYSNRQTFAMWWPLLHGKMPNMATLPPAPPNYPLYSNALIYFGYFIDFGVACCGSDMAMRQIRGEPVEVDSILRGIRNSAQILVYAILNFFIVFIGVCGCCIGMYAAYGLMLPGLALVADGYTATDAISVSYEGIKREWVMAALFSFVLMALVGLGSLVTVGLSGLVLQPMTLIIAALAYRDMIGISPHGGPLLSKGPRPWENSAPFDQSVGVWPPAPTALPPPETPPHTGPPPYGQAPPQSAGQPPTGPYLQTPLDKQDDTPME